ncbi:methyltransferase [Hoeflea olei]|uniref:Methyltransferase n=1 Tax=Hoeflea olei TaxID=1480615 RepID=A0A1C1YQB1_9HYPH|nr:methyltransferase [Hoeflea olei]
MPGAATATGAAGDAEPRPGFTLDAFHYGGFYLVQPEASGHRAGMDAMLLAATVPPGARGALADLGAGAGAAVLAAANRLPDLAVTLVERSPVMADCARRTLALVQNAHLAPRLAVLEADVSLHGDSRRAAGLADQAFDFVIMNPPFNPGFDRRTPDPLKAEAHVMETGDLFERWLRTAGAILRPGGQVSVIARPESVAEILAGLGKRFGGAEITPVCPRPGDDAIRMLVTAIKGSRARLSLRDRLLLHDGPGTRFTALMGDLGNGRAAHLRRSPARTGK